MGDVKAFLSQIEAATNPTEAEAIVKSANPDLVFALYKCLERVDSQEAKQFSGWLGSCLTKYNPTSSHGAGLYEFALHFTPQLIWLHLDLIGSTKHREVATNVECCLVCIYNVAAGGTSSRKEIRLAKLENASIYHDAHTRQHVTLTMSALQTSANITTLGRDPSCPERIDRIIGSNRSAVLRFILSQYCEQLGSRCAVSLIAFCHMCTRVCVSGFDLKKSSVHGVMSPGAIISPKVENCTKTESLPSADRLQPSISVDVLIGLRQAGRDDSNKKFMLDEKALSKLAGRARHCLAPEVYQELATGVHSCMFNGQEHCGMQALHALNWRATESLIPQVLMMTRALLHALNGPCGTPEDGFYGLSAQTFSTLPKILQHSILNRTTVDGAAPRDTPHISVQEPSPGPSPRQSTANIRSHFEFDANSAAAAAKGAADAEVTSSTSSTDCVETLV
ncbi:hyccin 2-like isoform X2 [Sycon ciliatum]|uniref:hyccin 2-like isoform X2 n=1 Tax=Sycon ciliatum TaxID=27933 RepID=UPI0031F6C203